MSYTLHDAIIVTAHFLEEAEPAHAKASELGLQVTDIVVSDPNGWATFLIAPDGSKEGWPESDAGDSARAQWKAWAREQRKLGAKRTFLRFVHVRYEDTCCGPVIMDSYTDDNEGYA